MTPGANVSAVARAHRVSPQQVFAWRRKAVRSGAIAILPAKPKVQTQSFAPVEVTPGDGDRAVGLEIVIGAATIRVGSGVAPALLVEAIGVDLERMTREATAVRGGKPMVLPIVATARVSTKSSTTS